jgi:hypothetical protein
MRRDREVQARVRAAEALGARDHEAPAAGARTRRIQEEGRVRDGGASSRSAKGESEVVQHEQQTQKLAKVSRSVGSRNVEEAEKAEKVNAMR